MGKLKVCVYAICKNEAAFVDLWMDSMSEADLIVVSDTGSTDDTVERLHARGAEVYVDIVKPWRFDVARNRSLEHVPEDVDICVCTDLDERFEPGWREKLEQAWSSYEPKSGEPISKSGLYLYNWSLKPDGTPDVQFTYFKVHQREGFIWRCPVHEYLAYVGSQPHEKVFIEGMVLNHYPDPEKSRGSYLPLLEMAVEEDPTGDRMRYYLGREYMFKGEWVKCRQTLLDYLELPSATWTEERCAAMRWIAKACYELGQKQESYSWYYRAIAELPTMRDAYVEFARICYSESNWPMCLYATKEALRIKERSTVYTNMGYSWDYTPDDLCALALYNLGLFDEAAIYAQRALTYEPEHERLKRNAEIMEKAALEGHR